MAAAEKGKKKRAPLSSFTILLIILVVLAIVTVIMSASGVEGVQGATLSQVLTAPVFGFQDAIGVCLFVMILGGFLGIVTETGALDAGIAALVHKLKGNELVLIPILMAIFSIGGTTYGMCEETVPFYLLLAATMVAAGFDSLTGAAVVLLGAGCGVLGSTVNPFAVGVAVDALSGIGIAVNQGIIIALGAILWLTTTIISIIFVMRYAKKVKADPKFSYSYEDREKFNAQWELDESGAAAREFGLRKKIVLVIFVAAFIIMIVGVMNLGWWFPQMAAEFVTLSILVMFIGGTGKDGVGEAKMVDAFGAGASSLVPVALIIGLARGVNHVLTEGMISDTMLNAASNLVAGMSGPLFVVCLLLIFFVLGFVVPSSSGLAVLAMPIFAPLADTVGIPRWIIVAAYQFGQYAMLYIAPTGLVMATLQMLDMKMSHWFKFVWPMMVFTLVFGAILLSICSVVFAV